MDSSTSHVTPKENEAKGFEIIHVMCLYTILVSLYPLALSNNLLKCIYIFFFLLYTYAEGVPASLQEKRKMAVRKKTRSDD